jgi:hypothetical protein
MHLASGFFGVLALIFTADTIDKMRFNELAVVQSSDVTSKILGSNGKKYSFVRGTINQRKGVANFNYRILHNGSFQFMDVHAKAVRIELNWKIVQIDITPVL